MGTIEFVNNYYGLYELNLTEPISSVYNLEIEYQLRSSTIVYIKQITIYDNEENQTVISDNVSNQINAAAVGTQLKIDTDMIGAYAADNNTLYMRTKSGDCSNPSENSNGVDHYYDDNLGDFNQSDWIKCDIENASQYVGKKYNGIVATKADGITPTITNLSMPDGVETTSIPLNSYVPHNFNGSKLNNDIFFVKPQINEYANFSGFFKEEDGKYYIYADDSDDILIDNSKGVITNEILHESGSINYYKIIGIVSYDNNSNTYCIIPVYSYGVATDAKRIESKILNHVITTSTGIVILDSLDSSMQIYNSIGTLVYDGKVLDNSQNVQLARGIYIVKIENITTKVIVGQ